MIGRATILALMPNFEAAEQVVPELGRLGIARADIYAASLDRRGLAGFCNHLGISSLDVLDNSASETRAVRERVSSDRMRYFMKRLEGKMVLLALPHVASGGDVATLLQRAGADFGPSPAAGDVNDVTVPLRAEHLEVVKYLVQNGTVRLHKEIITEVERFEVPLVREELVIERMPLNGAGEVETIRLPLHHEEVRVSKNVVVTNEVVIRRQQFEEIRHIEETVRYEQINVTKEGNVSMRESPIDQSFSAAESG